MIAVGVASTFMIYSINTSQVYTAVLLIIALYIRSPALTILQLEVVLFDQNLPISPTFQLWQPPSYSASLCSAFSDSTNTCYQTVFTFVVSVQCPQNPPEFLQRFPSFPWLSNISSLHTPHFLYPFIRRWILRLLPYLGYGKECAGMNMGVRLRLQHPDSTSLR